MLTRQLTLKKWLNILEKCVKDVEWDNFSSFQAPISKIVPKDLFEWINRHQQIASVFM